MRTLFTVVCLVCSVPVFLCGQSDSQVLSRVLQQFSKVHGASALRPSIESVYLRGIQYQNGQALSLTIHKKRPHFLRYQLGEGREAVVLGYDGGSGWEQKTTNGEVAVEELDAQATALLRAETGFSSPLLDDLYDPNFSIELKESEMIADEPVFCLVTSDPDGKEFRYYLSASTYYILKKEEFGPSGERLLTTSYRDYRLIEGYPFAYEVENLIDGETVALTKFEEIKINTGLLSFFFEMPKRRDP